MNTLSALFGYVELVAPGRMDGPLPAHSESIRLASPTTRSACFATGPPGLLATTEEAEGSDAAFLGELFNAAAPRGELEMLTDTPTARLLLRAFERWSVGCLERLDGICALACWHKGTLYLYRDGSAARNLYNAATADCGFAFSSGLDRLLKLTGIERRPNPFLVTRSAAHRSYAPPSGIHSTACRNRRSDRHVFLHELQTKFQENSNSD